MKPCLLLITNTANGCEEDRKFLAPGLTSLFDVNVVSHIEAVSLLADSDVYLLRNVWPFRVTKHDLRSLANVVRRQGIPGFNPVGPTNFVDDKTYLANLTREGFPVIPTVLDKADIEKLGEAQRYVIKPLDGCSSDGVQILSVEELAATDSAGHVLQPFVNFTHEVSLFFINNIFVYALRTKAERWDMEIWTPSAGQIVWAQTFVTWNAMSHGLQRIDAAEMPDGNFLLMEIEDTSPFLSLHILSPDLLRTVTQHLVEGLQKLCSVKS